MLKLSEKYWLLNDSEFGSYNVENNDMLGSPDNDPAIIAKFVFRINGQQISYDSPVYYKG